MYGALNDGYNSSKAALVPESAEESSEITVRRDTLIDVLEKRKHRAVQCRYVWLSVSLVRAPLRAYAFRHSQHELDCRCPHPRLASISAQYITASFTRIHPLLSINMALLTAHVLLADRCRYLCLSTCSTSSPSCCTWTFQTATTQRCS